MGGQTETLSKDNKALKASGDVLIVLPLLMLFCLFFFHLETLATFPSPFPGEAVSAARAQAFVSEGVRYGEPDRYVLESIGGTSKSYPILGTLVYSLAAEKGEFIELYKLRRISLVFGVVLLGACCLIGQVLGGPLFGLLFLFAIGTSINFSVPAHLAQVDIVAAAFGFIAIFIYLFNKESKPSLALLSGIFLAVGCEFQCRAGLLLPVIGALYLCDHGLKTFKNLSFWAFIVGLSSIVPLYFMLHYSPADPGNAPASTGVFNSTLSQILKGDARVYLRSISDLHHHLQSTLNSDYYLKLVALLYCVVYFRGNNRKVLWMALAGFFSAAPFVQPKTTATLIYVTPLFDLLLTWVIYKLFIDAEKLPDLLSKAGRIILIAVFFSTTLFSAKITWQSFKECPEELSTTQRAILAQYTPGDVILGDDLYWFGFQDASFVPWRAVKVFLATHPKQNISDALEYFAPRLVVTDGTSNLFLSDSPFADPFAESQRLPRTELLDALETHSIESFKTNTRCFSEVRVHKLEW